MISIGQTVVYGTEGVCIVSEIRKMKIGRETAQYYVLRPIYRENATVFVPLNNAALCAKMRPALTKNEIETVLSGLAQEDTPWIDDPAQRKESFQKILLSDDRRSQLHMVRLLYRHRRKLQELGKRLRMSDEQFLRDAEKLINDELSYALGIERVEVPAYIRGRLQE